MASDRPVDVSRQSAPNQAVPRVSERRMTQAITCFLIDSEERSMSAEAGHLTDYQPVVTVNVLCESTMAELRRIASTCTPRGGWIRAFYGLYNVSIGGTVDSRDGVRLILNLEVAA